MTAQNDEVKLNK